MTEYQHAALIDAGIWALVAMVLLILACVVDSKMKS